MGRDSSLPIVFSERGTAMTTKAINNKPAQAAKRKKIWRTLWDQKYLMLMSIPVLLYVLFFGTRYYGATRWISIAGYSIQPSELAKVALVLTLSRVLSLKFANINHPLWMLAAVVLIGIPFYLIYKEPDLGTALVMLVSSAAIIFSAKLKWRYILILAILIPIIGTAGYFSMKQYQRDRVKVFLV